MHFRLLIYIFLGLAFPALALGGIFACWPDQGRACFNNALAYGQIFLLIFIVVFLIQLMWGHFIVPHAERPLILTAFLVIAIGIVCLIVFASIYILAPVLMLYAANFVIVLARSTFGVSSETVVILSAIFYFLIHIFTLFLCGYFSYRVAKYFGARFQLGHQENYRRKMLSMKNNLKGSWGDERQ